MDAWGSPYKLCMKKASPTILATLKRDGNYTKTWKESANLLMQALISKDREEEEND